MTEINLRYLKEKNGDRFMPMITTDCILDFDKKEYDSNIDVVNARVASLETKLETQSTLNQQFKDEDDKQKQSINDLNLFNENFETEIQDVKKIFVTQKTTIEELKQAIENQKTAIEELTQRIEKLEGGTL